MTETNDKIVVSDNEGQVRVRVVGEYQMFGDSDPTTWAEETFTRGVTEGQILSYDVTGIYNGPFGLVLITFTADLNIGVGTDRDDAKLFARAVLNHVVGDSDVDVRWLMAVPYVDESN